MTLMLCHLFDESPPENGKFANKKDRATIRDLSRRARQLWSKLMGGYNLSFPGGSTGGERRGRGKCRYGDGIVYVGDFVNNIRHGAGQARPASGDM